METKKKRLIGILFGFALALAIMPVIGSGGTAYAADVEYSVWVDGTQVTSANMDDVLSNDPVNDGKVSFTGKGKYTGVTKATYKINPKGTSLKTPKGAKKAITVKWKKQSAKWQKHVSPDTRSSLRPTRSSPKIRRP